MRSFFTVLAFLSIAFVLLSFSSPSHAATTQLAPNCTDYTNCTTLYWNAKSTWANGVKPSLNTRADIQPYFCNILFYLPDNVTVSGIRFLPCLLANDTTVITLASSSGNKVPVTAGHFSLTNVTVSLQETLIEALGGVKLVSSTLSAVDTDSGVMANTLSADSSTLKVTNLQVGPSTGPCSVTFTGSVSINSSLVLNNCTGENTFTISKADSGMPLVTLSGSLTDNTNSWTTLDVSSLVLDVNTNYTFMTYSSAVVDFSSHTTLPGADYTVNFTATSAFLSRAGSTGGGLSMAAIIGISVAVGLGVLVVIIIIIVAVVRSRKGYSSI